MKIRHRQPWSNREDEVLRAAVTKYGFQNWGRVASMLRATNRTGQECEARWTEYLQPSINHGEWTKEEEDLLESLVETWGSNWRTISQQLPGRTATQCQEKHGQLLMLAASAEGADGMKSSQKPGTDSSSAAQFLQTDMRNEVRAARQDTVDADSQEMLMLDEARARLANTKGRKDLRKQKERAMLAAKQRAEIQRHRELKAAAAVVEHQDGEGEGGEGEDDDDFVPISTKDIDRAGVRSKGGKGGRQQQRNDGSMTEEEILDKARKIASSSFGTDDRNNNNNATTSSSVGVVNNNNTASFSFNSNKIMDSTSNKDNNNSNIMVPRALQEKRAKAALALALQQQQKTKQQQEVLRLKQQHDASSSPSLSNNQLSSSIFAAIQDGGRTRREQEAMNRNGATMSFVQWLRTKNNNNNNNSEHQADGTNTSSSSLFPIPDPRAIQRVAENSSLSLSSSASSPTVEEQIESLILNQLLAIASEDNTKASSNDVSNNQHHQNNTNNNNNVIAPFAFSSLASTARNDNNKQQQQQYTNSFTSWADECATKELNDAAKMIEDEFQKVKQDEAVEAAPSSSTKTENFEITDETAALASVITESILTQTAEFKNFQRRLENINNKSTDNNNNNNSSSLMDDFFRVCQDNAESHEDFVRSKVIAAVTNEVRLWEESCLKSVYQNHVDEYATIRNECDDAEKKLLEAQ